MKTYQRVPSEPDQEQLFVNISEYEVVGDGTTLIAYGLGACVGLAIYDPKIGVGGLARAMLPRQSDGSGTSDGKYVDAAVETMVREAISAGAGFGTLEGYVVGGGDLLDLQQLPREVSENNVVAAHEAFESLDVPVEGTDVRGNHGRTIEFDTEIGELQIITAHDVEPTLLRPAETGED